MLRFLADEDLDLRILRGLEGQLSGADLVRVQEAGLTAASDPVVSAWAARIVRTQDVTTLPALGGLGPSPPEP